MATGWSCLARSNGASLSAVDPLRLAAWMMRLGLRIWMTLAGCGFLLGLAVHGLALAGVTIPGGSLVFALHAGVFVVGLPAMDFAVSFPRRRNKLIPDDCALWMRRTLYFLIGYAVLNLIFVLVVFKVISPQKSPTNSPWPLRAFSSYWMLFYGIFFAQFHSRLQIVQQERERRCPGGHVVPAGNRACPTCGHDFPQKNEPARTGRRHPRKARR